MTEIFGGIDFGLSVRLTPPKKVPEYIRLTDMITHTFCAKRLSGKQIDRMIDEAWEKIDKLPSKDFTEEHKLRAKETVAVIISMTGQLPNILGYNFDHSICLERTYIGEMAQYFIQIYADRPTKFVIEATGSNKKNEFGKGLAIFGECTMTGTEQTRKIKHRLSLL